VKELGFSIAHIRNVDEHIINDVVPGSLAHKSGLKVDDYLIEVNGENVERMSHTDTVGRIVQLSKNPNVDICLLVRQRDQLNSPSKSDNKQFNGLTSIVNEVLNDNYEERLPPPPPVKIDSTSNSKLASSSSNLNELPTNSPPLHTLPVAASIYPEIRVCEFVGYPRGTQLGLVITSDDYSHDIVKVADDGPAHKAGLCKGDVILTVNEVNVEGDLTAIENLNDFSEIKPLRVVVASRYAYEWSKLLRIRISDRDWPNIRRIRTTKMNHHQSSFNESKSGNNSKLKSNLTRSNINTISNTSPSYYNNNNNNNKENNYRDSQSAVDLDETYVYHRPSPVNHNSNINNTNRRYQQLRNTSSNSSNNLQQQQQRHQPQININVQHQHRCFTPTPTLAQQQQRTHTPSHQLYSQYYPTRSQTSTGSSTMNHPYHQQQQHRDDGCSMHSILSTLSRSAVDITADGKVLRMCTLILNPDSSSPVDSEFGFDLVTKVRNSTDTLNASYNNNDSNNYTSTLRSASTSYGDYFIDTVDEMSPANLAGLKSGDRLVEVDGCDVKHKTFEEV
jgi:C-terminal processing protease CtpA/Prc